MRAIPIFKPRDAFAVASSVVEFHFESDDVASRGFVACAEVVFERLNRDNRPNGRTEPSLSVGDLVLFMERATPVRLLEVAPMGFEEVADPKELRAAGMIALDSATNATRQTVGIRPRTVAEAREDAAYAERLAAAVADQDAKRKGRTPADEGISAAKRDDEERADKVARMARTVETLRARARSLFSHPKVAGASFVPELVKTALVERGFDRFLADEVRSLLAAAENYNGAVEAVRKVIAEPVAAPVADADATEARRVAGFVDEDPDGDFVR